MKNILIILSLIFFCLFNAQHLEKTARKINEEGIELYRSEMASWYGTDVFIANYKARENIGGYFSYIDNKVPKCILFSKENKVLATIAFPANYNPKDAKLDITERDFTPVEKDYFTIRQKALERTKTDTIFKHYQNTSLNIVPIIRNNVKKVYVLTGPSISNVVVFGNDYLLTFTNKNEIKTVEKLHNSMIVQNINDEKTGKTVSGVHSHVIENWQAITPTDICTLMLYQKFTGWEGYTTVSKKLVSIWNPNNNLVIMKTEDFKNMSENILKNKKEKSQQEKMEP
ncbi:MULTISPECIES: hypothetical protein [Chryseobacterium]|uniref:Uncharacterized protein n=1 Tax=Chryseobacterium camelliae TaxID=1265445 RepID=A0ABU0TDF5_9FLAO|nr:MULTISPECIES: hypothetical protein [Chryseobacterium]MDQ1094876.1 hypothetical protein [Chryseobacterium camelliae]MDR6086167.1 hypothetical protein [Chryseobacterium sp. SORGH_AS_0909]